MARNLFSSFIRSAVNQVGRDGGRVVSNAIYGDKHSIPVRSVGGNSYAQSTYIPIEKTVARKNINVGNFTLFVYLFISFAIPYIGPICLIFNGLKRKNRKEIKIKRLVSRDIYTPDEAGQKDRFDGQEMYVSNEKVPSTLHELEIDHRIGRIYLIGGIIILILHIVLSIYSYGAGQ